MSFWNRVGGDEGRSQERGVRRRLVCCLAVALLVVTVGCMKRPLASGLTEAEAREIIVLLQDHGISADLQEVSKERAASSYTVSVMGGGPSLVQAWRVMQDNGLPRHKASGLEDVYANPGLIPTAAQEKAKLLVGLAGEISRMLNSVQGVVDARVQVVLPDDNPLIDRSQWHPPSASVLLKYQGKEPPLKEEQIKSLVAKGVEGLAPENIAVVFNKVEPKPPPERDVFWLLQNQQFVLALMALLILESCTLMIFLGKSRHQAMQIDRLNGMLAAERKEVETAVRR
jgi:type III secretion protein J